MTTPILTAAEQGYLDIVKKLVDAGSDVNVQDDSTGNTALRLAIINGHDQTALYLIQCKANVNYTAKDTKFVPRSLLISAIRQFNNTTKPLYKHTVDGERPKAERDVWLQVVKAMLEHDVSVTFRGYGMESSPLVESVESSDSRVLHLLLKGGAQVNQKTHVMLNVDPQVDSALSLACLTDNVTAVHLLIKYGAKVTDISHSLFQYLLFHKHYDCARVLVLAGIPVSNTSTQYIRQVSQHLVKGAYSNSQSVDAIVELCGFIHQVKPLNWMCRTVLRNACHLYIPKVVAQTKLPMFLCDYVLCYSV